jgi:hypothetical protein
MHALQGERFSTTMSCEEHHFMLPTILREFDTLASSHTPQLVASLVVCGALLITADRWLAIVALLVQRLIVVALLWANLEPPLAATWLLAAIASVVLYVFAEGRLLLGKVRGGKLLDWHSALLPQVAFRGSVAGLGMLVTYGLVQAFPPDLLPLTVGTAVISLLVTAILVLLVADGGLGMGLGVQTFMDAGRVIYALWGPDTVVWGLWAALDVMVALAASQLHSAEAPAVNNDVLGGEP